MAEVVQPPMSVAQRFGEDRTRPNAHRPDWRARLALLLQQIPSGFDLRSYLEALEQRLIGRAMQAAGGTVAQAARLLGLRRTTLVEKLRKYSLTGSDTVASET